MHSPSRLHMQASCVLALVSSIAPSLWRSVQLTQHPLTSLLGLVGAVLAVWQLLRPGENGAWSDLLEGVRHAARHLPQLINGFCAIGHRKRLDQTQPSSRRVQQTAEPAGSRRGDAQVQETYKFGGKFTTCCNLPGSRQVRQIVPAPQATRLTVIDTAGTTATASRHLGRSKACDHRCAWCAAGGNVGFTARGTCLSTR